MKSITLKNLLSALALWAFFSPLAAADEFDDYRKCLLKVGEMTLEGKIDFQNGVAELVLSEDPALGALAILNRDLQIALARARAIKLTHLIETDLPRLVSASGLTRFLNFNWDSIDEVNLQAENPDYARLADQIKILGETSDPHPGWPELRARFVALQKTENFQDLLEDLNEAQEDAGERLEKC